MLEGTGVDEYSDWPGGGARVYSGAAKAPMAKEAIMNLYILFVVVRQFRLFSKGLFA